MGDGRVVKLFGWVIIVLYVVISLWMIIGQGIRLGTKDKDERRARRGGAVHCPGSFQVNCHRRGLLTIIGIQVIYPAYYDNNIEFGLLGMAFLSVVLWECKWFVFVWW